jgi:hypothetical protein
MEIRLLRIVDIQGETKLVTILPVMYTSNIRCTSRRPGGAVERLPLLDRQLLDFVV